MNAIADFYNLPDSTRSAEAESLKASELQVGFIAQEVEAAAKQIMFDFHGVEKPANEQSHYGLRYAEFVPSLVKAVQELHQENESLRAKLAKTDKQLMQLTEKIASGKLDE